MKLENPPLEALAMNFLEASPVFLTFWKKYVRAIDLRSFKVTSEI